MAGKPERFGGKPSPIFFPAISFRPSRIFFPAISFRAFGGKGESFCFGGKGITLFAAGTTICFVCFVPRDVLLSPSLHSLALSLHLNPCHPPITNTSKCRLPTRWQPPPKGVHIHYCKRYRSTRPLTITRHIQLDIEALLKLSIQNHQISHHHAQ